MLQRIAQDKRVTDDEQDGYWQQHPRARKDSIMSNHRFHPLAATAEITRSKGPSRGQTAGR